MGSKLLERPGEGYLLVSGRMNTDGQAKTKAAFSPVRVLVHPAPQGKSSFWRDITHTHTHLCVADLQTATY